MSLAYAFQTKYKLYMVMDFVQGGDFFTFLRKVGRMRESWAKLYICEIALALQHMHDLDVVYRDLKPEVSERSEAKRVSLDEDENTSHY